MNFKYSILNQNQQEEFGIIEAENIMDAIKKLKEDQNTLFLLSIDYISGGKLGLWWTNQINISKKQIYDFRYNLEEKIENKKKEKINNDLQNAIEESQNINKKINQVYKDLEYATFFEKAKFILNSSPKELKTNIKILQEIKLKQQMDFSPDKNKFKAKSNITDNKEKANREFNLSTQFVRDDSTIGKLKKEPYEEESFGSVEIKEQRKPKGKGKIKNKDILLFTRQLQVMIKADVGLSEALLSLASSSNEKLNNMILDIRDELLEGSSLSEAMAYYPQYFDSTYLALIAIGEESSGFYEVLEEIVAYKEQQDLIRGKIKTTAIYPIILGLLLSFMGIGASIFFIPMIKDMYESSDIPIPGITQLVFDIAGNLHIVIPLIFLVIFIVRILYSKVPGVKIWWDKIWHKFLLKAPIIKNISTIFYMYNFSSTLSIMIKNGIRLQTALKLSKNSIKNIYIRKEIEDINTLVTKEGYALSDAIEQQPHFDNIIRVIAITGEKTGDLGRVLKDVSHYYNKEIVNIINNTMAMIEPLSMIVIGIIVAPLAIGIYKPILEMSTGGFLNL